MAPRAGVWGGSRERERDLEGVAGDQAVAGAERPDADGGVDQGGGEEADRDQQLLPQEGGDAAALDALLRRLKLEAGAAQSSTRIALRAANPTG
ncbi:hypothetical protein [Streptomyces sp. NPDC054838]